MAALSELRAGVQGKCQDPDGIHYTSVLVDGYLNEILLQACKELRLLRATFSGGVTPGALYDLSAITDPDLTVLEVMRVWWNDQELTYLTGDEMAAMSGYPTEEGTPVYYGREMAGFSGLRFHPIPNADAVVDAVVAIEYIGAAIPLAADDDVPGIPIEYHDALIDGATALAFEDDVPIAQQAKAPKFWAKYQAKAAHAAALVSANFQLKPAGSRRQIRRAGV